MTAIITRITTMRMIHICQINRKRYSASEQARVNSNSQITISHPIGESVYLQASIVSDRATKNISA